MALIEKVCNSCRKVHEEEQSWCALSPESRLYPGLHQKSDQQTEGGYSSPLLHSSEIPPGVLSPALGSPAQEEHGPVRAGPGEGEKNS